VPKCEKDVLNPCEQVYAFPMGYGKTYSLSVSIGGPISDESLLHERENKKKIRETIVFISFTLILKDPLIITGVTS
jgi:hypothetical protein